MQGVQKCHYHTSRPHWFSMQPTSYWHHVIKTSRPTTTNTSCQSVVQWILRLGWYLWSSQAWFHLWTLLHICRWSRSSRYPFAKESLVSAWRVRLWRDGRDWKAGVKAKVADTIFRADSQTALITVRSSRKLFANIKYVYSQLNRMTMSYTSSLRRKKCHRLSFMQTTTNGAASGSLQVSFLRDT